MNDEKTESLLNEFNLKYGFVLNLVNKSNTDNFPQYFYRVRLVERTEKIKNIEQLSYPKSGISLGRCNLENEPVFYCSDKSTTAFREILKYRNPINKDVYLSVWKFKPGINISIFPLLNKAVQKGIILKSNPLEIIPDIEKKIKAENQLLEIEKYFYDENHLQSACVSNLLFRNAILPCDCIFYPSAIENEIGINISVKTEYFNENFEFQRAYKFEFSGSVKDYKVLPLKYTLSKSNELVWAEADLRELIFRTLINVDLHQHVS
jgi:hypothetical protein